MQAVVDRIEGDRAVLVVQGGGGTIVEMPLHLLPPVREGDVLEICIAKIEGAAEEARSRVGGLVEKLKRKRAEGTETGDRQ
jgi:hypothetical protein